jgi:succinate-semialdehyde dehydrogenase/glutarate-semialdehyde dehydrogenase
VTTSTTTPSPSAATRHGVAGSVHTGDGVWIGGTWSAAASGAQFAVEDPATGLVLARVADAGPEDAVRAVAAAADAFTGWRRAAPRHRSDVLRRAFDLMVERRDALADLIVAENGKSHADALAEVTYAAEFFRWFSEEAVRDESQYAPAPDGGRRTFVAHQPVGVCLLITPWNFPAAMATRKIAPALAAGCTVVLKPAAETPLTALAVAALLHEAGVPAGVVNVLPTTAAAAVTTAVLDDSRVRKLSFTGSTAVGRLLLRQAADRVVNCSMELGGNAPFVVCDDADLDAAVAGALVAKMRGGGQACTAANRFYVHEAVADEFVTRFGDAVAGLSTGPGADPRSQVGPLISRAAVEKVSALVDDALGRGAVASHQGRAVPDAGHFYPPTVLRDVPRDAEILRTEIFGPVAPVVTWRDEADLVREVNGVEDGLVAYVYSRDLQRALRLSERLESGMVGINRGVVSDPSTPFGGVKQSGLGREGAREGLRAFTETQYLSVDWPEDQR